MFRLGKGEVFGRDCVRRGRIGSELADKHLKSKN